MEGLLAQGGDSIVPGRCLVSPVGDLLALIGDLLALSMAACLSACGCPFAKLGRRLHTSAAIAACLLELLYRLIERAERVKDQPETRRVLRLLDDRYFVTMIGQELHIDRHRIPCQQGPFHDGAVPPPVELTG